MSKPIKKLGLSLGGNPLYVRAGTPDQEDFIDHLVREAYDVVGRDVAAPKLIIDCGAYAGFSSLFFVQRYPDAHLIVIEPDEENFGLCRLNLEPYASRVTLVQGAVWPEPAMLTLHRRAAYDEREWASTVSPAEPSAPGDVRGVALGDLLSESGFEQIDLLILNINGSEEGLFSRNQQKWLPRVKNIIVQLHDEASENAFFTALNGYQFLMTRFPTILALTNIAPAAYGIDPAIPDASNLLPNGDFENIRVEPAKAVPGAWIPGSSDIALDWHIAVCDPAFHVSLAVRTGKQRTGDAALLVRTNPDHIIGPRSAPYVAIENRTRLSIHAGEDWRLASFQMLCGLQNADEPALGAYTFLRLFYDDGSTHDLPAEAQTNSTDGYVEQVRMLHVPESPANRILTYATVWLYVWLANADSTEAPLTRTALWEVLFDDISCTKI